jgi:hypothetical protein
MLGSFLLEVMDGFNGTIDECAEEFTKRIAALLKVKWMVGAKDRGLSRLDYAVLATYKKRKIVICTCPSKEVAAHICSIHNKELSK